MSHGALPLEDQPYDPARPSQLDCIVEEACSLAPISLPATPAEQYDPGNYKSKTSSRVKTKAAKLQKFPKSAKYPPGDTSSEGSRSEKDLVKSQDHSLEMPSERGEDTNAEPKMQEASTDVSKKGTTSRAARRSKSTASIIDRPRPIPRRSGEDESRSASRHRQSRSARSSPAPSRSHSPTVSETTEEQESEENKVASGKMSAKRASYSRSKRPASADVSWENDAADLKKILRERRMERLRVTPVSSSSASTSTSGAALEAVGPTLEEAGDEVAATGLGGVAVEEDADDDSPSFGSALNVNEVGNGQRNEMAVLDE